MKWLRKIFARRAAPSPHDCPSVGFSIDYPIRVIRVDERLGWPTRDARGDIMERLQSARQALLDASPSLSLTKLVSIEQVDFYLGHGGIEINVVYQGQRFKLPGLDLNFTDLRACRGDQYAPALRRAIAGKFHAAGFRFRDEGKFETAVDLLALTWRREFRDMGGTCALDRNVPRLR